MKQRLNKLFCSFSLHTTTSLVASCQSYEVSWNNHCYYLDGSGGNCVIGYSRAKNAVMACINTQFVGKTYRSTSPSNCYIRTADTYKCYRLSFNCNAPGPFIAGPIVHIACFNTSAASAQHLTFRGSI
jgi:hypothetical protein